MSPDRVTFEIEVNVHVLAKAAGVVVSLCLGITKRLQDAIGLEENVFNPSNTKKSSTSQQ